MSICFTTTEDSVYRDLAIAREFSKLRRMANRAKDPLFRQMCANCSIQMVLSEDMPVELRDGLVKGYVGGCVAP